MPTVLRQGRYRIQVFTNDHGPVHVHVTAGGGAAKVLVPVAGGAPRIIRSYSLSKAELRRIQELVNANAEFLIQQWRRVHDENA